MDKTINLYRNKDVHIMETIIESEQETVQLCDSECNDPNCELFKQAMEIYKRGTRTYNLFVVSLSPFRFIIARRIDGKYHQGLNHEFNKMKK